MKVPIICLIAFAASILIFIIFVKISILKQHNLITRSGTFIFLDKILIIVSIVGILITSIWDFNYLQYKSPIPHDKWQLISLKDFKGLKMPKKTLDGETKFAYVSSSVRTKKYSNKIEIETLFHPCRSYVYNKDLFADGLLTHEMYHFHITEYCARLMRKEIQDRINSNEIINLNDIKSKSIRHEQELQYQYDDETYHSYVYGKQIDWQNKVDSLLKSLEDYSNTIISLKNEK